MSAPVDLTSIRGRSCLITGGASGLGLATSTKFAAHGAYVTIADVQDKLGEEVVAKLTAEGQKVSYVHCDITDWDSSVAAFKHAIEFSPSKTLDVVALYAGVGSAQPNLVDHTKSGDPKSEPVAPTHKAIDVNLLGSYYSSSLALHYLQTSERTMQKSLILVASLAAYSKSPPGSSHCTTRSCAASRPDTDFSGVPQMPTLQSRLYCLVMSSSSSANAIQWTIPIQTTPRVNTPPGASSGASACAHLS